MNLSENLKKLSETIIKIGSPLLGSVVAGPAGAAIGNIIASTFNGKIENVDDLINKIKTSSDSNTKLAEIFLNHKIEIEKIALEQSTTELIEKNKTLSLDYKNIENARKSNITTGTKMPHVISIFILIAFFLCIYIVLNHKNDIENKDIVYMLIGTLSASFGSVITYWIGSSTGSRNKEAAMFDQMNELMRKQ